MGSIRISFYKKLIMFKKIIKISIVILLAAAYITSFVLVNQRIDEDNAKKMESLIKLKGDIENVQKSIEKLETKYGYLFTDSSNNEIDMLEMKQRLEKLEVKLENFYSSNNTIYVMP